MRQCPKCLKEKTLTDFYEDIKRHPKCKECHREECRIRNKDYYYRDIEEARRRGKENYHKNIEEGRRKARELSRNNIVHWNNHRIRSSEWNKNHPKYKVEDKRLSNKKYRQENPERHKAINALNHAVSSGVLDKPIRCEICKNIVDKRLLHGHHWKGYEIENALTVQWLCYSCHELIHSLHPEVLLTKGEDKA